MRKELPPEKEFHNTAYSDLYLFEGSIDKIVVDTEDDCFSTPKPGQEVRQRITIHPGSAALTRYYLDESLINCTREMRRYRGMVNEKMMNYVAEYFRHSHDEMVIDGVAKWKIELTNTDGKMWSFYFCNMFSNFQMIIQIIVDMFIGAAFCHFGFMCDIIKGVKENFMELQDMVDLLHIYDATEELERLKNTLLNVELANATMVAY